MATIGAIIVGTWVFGYATSEFANLHVHEYGSSIPRACSFAECGRAGCDETSAPFLCVDPATAFYGCSSAPWPETYCADSCSLAECATAEPPKTMKSCEGIKCPPEKCDPLVHYQKCGGEAPYQCTGGSSAMGCSADPYGWLLVPDTTCSGCCDFSAC